jgi:hypothetical protein
MKTTFLSIGVIAILAGAAWADSVNTLDAKSTPGQVVEITPQSIVVQDGKNTQTIPRADVADLMLDESRDVDVMTHTSSPVVVTAAGAKLTVADVDLASGGTKMSFINSLAGGKSLDLSAISRVYFPAANRNLADIDKISLGLKIPDRAMDFLVMQRKAGDFMVLDGVLKEINKENVIFTWKGEDRRIARTSVVQLRLGGAKAAPAGNIIGVMRGVQEGSKVPFTALSLKDGEFKVAAPDLGELAVRRSEVAAVEFVSDRVVDLSTLKPSDVKEHAFFDKPFPMQINRSAGGGLLKLGGNTHLSGLGLHSFCQVTYQLGGAYNLLVALTGIDDSVRPAGNARLTILGDGKELDKPIDVTGKTPPVQLRVKVAGVKQLVIRVDFGADKLDVGDHVDLVRARLIK